MSTVKQRKRALILLIQAGHLDAQILKDILLYGETSKRKRIKKKAVKRFDRRSATLKKLFIDESEEEDGTAKD